MNEISSTIAKDLFPNITEDDPIMIEFNVLYHFMGWEIKSPVKLLKRLATYANGLHKDSIEFRQALFLMKDKNPVQLLKQAYNKLVDYLIVVNRFIGEGYHGFIELKDNLYPIMVETRPNWMESPWHPDDEHEICHKAVGNWMDENRDVLYFNGRVVLFKNYGFSGQPMYVRMKRSKMSTGSGLRKMPGTDDLYYDPGKFTPPRS